MSDTRRNNKDSGCVGGNRQAEHKGERMLYKFRKGFYSSICSYCKNTRNFIAFFISLVLIGNGYAYAGKAEKITITWATIGGFYTEWARNLAQEFEAKKGISIEIVGIDYPELYENQVTELKMGSEAYDIITYEPAWKSEFASEGWLAPLNDYIAASDPESIAIDDIAPALWELTGQWRGKTYGLPYYTFTSGYFYRYDLFNDVDEKQAFRNRYGYELDIPQTYDQMADIAEFFHRKAGDKLKGKVLKNDFYGIGLMAGRFPQIQDEIMSIAWNFGAQLIKDDGSPGTTDRIFIKAVEFYIKKLLPHAPPNATSSGFDAVVGQMRQGLIAQTAGFYLDQWPNIVKTETQVPGAEMAAAASPGAASWLGAFCLGLSRNSKHPKESFEFIKFLASPEGQLKFAKGGGTVSRISILSDTAFIKSNRKAAAHYPVLLQILEHNYNSKFYPNFFYVRESGKIYAEETIWFAAAASGGMSIKKAMQNLADAIEYHCGGKCRLFNGHLGDGYHPELRPFTFDKSGWIRK